LEFNRKWLNLNLNSTKLLNRVNENALLVELKRRGLKAKNQVPIKVSYKENVVGEYIADILVEGNVIVEVKRVENLDKVHPVK